jgi:hypothetical protein
MRRRDTTDRRAEIRRLLNRCDDKTYWIPEELARYREPDEDVVKYMEGREELIDKLAEWNQYRKDLENELLHMGPEEDY